MLNLRRFEREEGRHSFAVSAMYFARILRHSFAVSAVYFARIRRYSFAVSAYVFRAYLEVLFCGEGLAALLWRFLLRKALFDSAAKNVFGRRKNFP